MYAEKFLIHKDKEETIHDDSIPSNLDFVWVEMEVSPNTEGASLFLDTLFNHTLS
jgi:hypothetical protein